jgi:hypothetical protein
MTTQAPADFGTDIWIDPATGDADAMWSTVSGVALVRQDLRIRLQTDSLPYDSADFAAALPLATDSADWGFDLNRLAGQTAGEAATYQGRIKRVALKDRRIDSAAVSITETTANGLTTLRITVACKTVLGPFALVFQLDPAAAPGSQLSLIENQ